MTPIIEINGLSKAYVISHQRDAAYDSLRDDIANILRPFQPHITQGAARETVWALDDVSFDVQQGEIFGVIGANGAGKSTLLKILSRITFPTKGRAVLHGSVGSLLEVGTGFHPELTGRENIFLNGAILGIRKQEIAKKFDEIVAFSEVDRFLDTPVKFYSSGMYVRLAFAVAAHLEPDILIVDEVLSVGDTAFQKKSLGKMQQETQEGGRTVLFVSHNMGAVSSLCDRGILLSEGRIAYEGDIGAVVNHYLTAVGSADYTGDLTDHPNRARGFDPLLTSFDIETDNGVILYGQPVTLRIGYHFPEAITVPQFSVKFLNAQGVVAFTVVSDYQPNNIPPRLQGNGSVACRIHSLPLLPGNYTVNLRLWQPGAKLDDIENVARVTVEWMDRKPDQIHWDSTMGIVYVDAAWSMLSAT